MTISCFGAALFEIETTLFRAVSERWNELKPEEYGKYQRRALQN